MQLIRGERILYESPGGRLTLTTHRVRYSRRRFGEALIQSVMLEQIASCSMSRLTHPWLLVLALLSILGGAVATGQQNNPAGLVVGVLFALLLLVAYFRSREQVLAIASPGATIHVNTKHWSFAEVRELMDRIEAAKDARCFPRRSESDRIEPPPLPPGRIPRN